jgi:hypothetical protein
MPNFLRAFIVLNTSADSKRFVTFTIPVACAYQAKPKVRAQAMVAINEGGLDRLLDVVRPTA